MVIRRSGFNMVSVAGFDLSGDEPSVVCNVVRLLHEILRSRYELKSKCKTVETSGDGPWNHTSTSLSFGDQITGRLYCSSYFLLKLLALPKLRKFSEVRCSASSCNSNCT